MCNGNEGYTLNHERALIYVHLLLLRFRALILQYKERSEMKIHIFFDITQCWLLIIIDIGRNVVSSP
jgi:hypothetical protein